MRIGLDLQGSDAIGDQPTQVLVDAALCALNGLDAKTHLTLYGLPEVLDSIEPNERLHLVPCSQEITMHDDPLLAMRRKKDASMLVAMRELKQKKIDALVSTGNTGALIASSTLTLSRLPGVDRPGLLALLPTLTGSVAVIDIGAHVDPKPEHLYQFARMGAAYQSCSSACSCSRVGLLNIGTEPLKGTRTIRETYNLLSSQSDLHFVGNIEGRDAFSGIIDVLVCGGFAGNIFLKTAEGISMFILEHLRNFFGDALTPKVEEALQALDERFNYAQYPGALVCGVDGVVIKCHGFSSKEAVMSGLRGAERFVEGGLLPAMRQSLNGG